MRYHIEPSERVVMWRDLREDEEQEALKIMQYLFLEAGEELNDISRSVMQATIKMLKACVIETVDGEQVPAMLFIGSFDTSVAKYEPDAEITPVSDEGERVQ